MENFKSMYESYMEFSEKTFLLGEDTPKELSKTIECLIDNFLYTYSYLGLAAEDFFSIKELKIKLLEGITSLKNYASLSDEQRWWGISLIYFKIATTNHNIYFLDGVIDTLLDKLHDLSEEELVEYCNEMNDACGSLIGFDLRIRPSCNNNNKTYISEILFKTAKNKDRVVSILKENFTLKEVTSDAVFREQIIISNFHVNKDPWMCVFDIFAGQILAITESTLSDLVIKEDLPSAIEIALLDLLSNSEHIPRNLSSICEEIASVIE